MKVTIKNETSNESQNKKPPKFWGLGGLPDGINYGVAVALANLFAAYGVGYIIAVTIANLVIADGIGYVVAVAITYFIAPDGIDYGVAVTLADLAAPDGVNYIVAVPSADARVGGWSSSGSNVGRLAGAEVQQGEKYVKEFLHYLMYLIHSALMLSNSCWVMSSSSSMSLALLISSSAFSRVIPSLTISPAASAFSNFTRIPPRPER